MCSNHFLTSKTFLGKTFKIKQLTDREKVFNVNVGNKSSTGKRFIIDFRETIEIYNDDIIDDIICIGKKFNLAYSTTKHTILLDFMKLS